MDYLLGLDLGTTGAKALLVAADGRVVASAVSEYPLITPRPGWAEQDAGLWWQATVAAIRQVLQTSGAAPEAVRAVGLTGQMHGSVFLDSADRVIRPPLLWCDQRTAEQCHWINEQVGERVVAEETLNPVLTGFTAPKIIWLRQQEPENYRRMRKILLPKDYIRFLLTGEYATEVSDASGTSLLNVRARRWSQKLLAGLELAEGLLPRVYESPEITGAVSERAGQETGLRAGTPVMGGGGDQAAGGVGNGIVRPGLISVTTGTSGVVFASMEEPRTDPRLRTHTFCHAVPGKWHVMGVMLSAGGSLRWYRDVVADQERQEAKARGVDPYEVIAERAAQAPAGSEGLIFLPYLTGERTPYPDPHARGVYFGLSLSHGRPHLARAVLEGVAYGLRDSLEIIRALGLEITQVRASGGGARSALWRQIQADVFRCELVTINVDEGPAFGAALLAAVGAGIFPSVEAACEQTIHIKERTGPRAGTSEVYARCYPLYRSLYQSLKDDFARLAKVGKGG